MRSLVVRVGAAAISLSCVFEKGEAFLPPTADPFAGNIHGHGGVRPSTVIRGRTTLKNRDRSSTKDYRVRPRVKVKWKPKAQAKVKKEFWWEKRVVKKPSIPVGANINVDPHTAVERIIDVVKGVEDAEATERLALRLSSDWRPIYNDDLDLVMSAMMDGDSSTAAAASPLEASPEIEAEPADPPVLLKWLKDKGEEEREVNRFINVFALFSIVFAAFSSFLAVDAEISRGWTAEERLSRLPFGNLQLYLRMSKEEPVLTKALTSGLVYALGDVTAQTNEGTCLSLLNRRRLVRSAVAGFCLHGPGSHAWYLVSDRLVDGSFALSGWQSTLAKGFLDRAFWAPFFNALLYAFFGVYEGDSPQQIAMAVRSSAYPLWVAGLRFWPFVNIVTYGVVPSDLRVLWIGFVSIFWVTFVSRQAADLKRQQQQQQGLSAVVQRA
uniref:Uncharacterized protein n=1 Tax=Chromera velia CCMP2878 TaxID=1169474 RepID=A0A0G4IAS0_9ALVE|mmetsp:Transcript_30272/g.59465  ORF Transcript_30272/g.59465 Transcript_30272/m.59465 type:complete len:438 (-) Transcript_30272:662-1975(-)|eukprot:Cvel_12523.t1-p1 / transcript=Cvel_12523.t1 / gene=Cvel_12523 / organism=Chromera_velia_CCMP2878 / gene_product=Peroxisomal membrane protein 2, putative / transcript_product=Peroxisomal membrane protein 2, putative / location=Cvel_scaffold822:21883-24429(-) / protein_length=437 / sequence_SO=supercontig / SO=protein_coding / is_pseudo=false